MTAKKLFLFWILLMCQMVCAQKDSIVALKEVIVSDSQLKNFSNTQSVAVLNDSIIAKNGASLTSLLNYNSVIYFKENGLGMVSSPSFRGTTAQQTAVIWNGININSQLIGQTDFNTITTRDYTSITVRSGGGSSIYGSSAMGGSIHLNNELTFKNQFQNELFLSYGSFNTFLSNYKINFSNKKVANQISVSRNSSTNDYEYLDSKNKKNENGQFNNTSMNVSFGYKLNSNNILKFYSQVYDGERHFPLFSSSENKTKYNDFTSRNLLVWSSVIQSFVSTIKIGFLSEEYKYFSNIKNDFYSFGKVETALAKYDLSYQWKNKMLLNVVLDYSKNQGKGTSLPMVKREIYSSSINFKHQIGSHFKYEASIRKEETASYKSPVLFSVGTIYSPVSFYSVKFNLSRNYRIPTYNDLYWEDLGNTNLKAESSFQGEIGNVFTFKNWSFTGTFYRSEIEDMIRWIPKEDGNFKPENTAKVSIFGFESGLIWVKTIHQHQIKWNATYGYSKSEDKASFKQLVYVPFHKMTASLAYSYKGFSANYQYLYNGKVFTRSDNDATEIIDWYAVSNMDFSYSLGKVSKYNLGFRILNLWNEKYQNVENRPLPGRNFNMYITFKF